MKHKAIFAAALFMALFAAEAAAARTVVIRNVNLRAGPDIGYPVVARVSRNTPIKVYGCLDDWYWCDVSYGRYRGWVAADYIHTRYKNRNVTIIEAGPVMHVPVVGFNIDYWDEHYRTQRFYRDRDRWVDHDWHHDHGVRDHGRGRGRH